MAMESVEDESSYRQENELADTFPEEMEKETEKMPTYCYQRLCDHSQPLLKTKNVFSEKQLKSVQNFQPQSVDILNDGKPAIKKLRCLDQHIMTDGPMEETFFPTLLDGGYNTACSRPPSPECAYSDHFVTRARMCLDSGDMAVHDQSFCSTENLVSRSLADCSAVSEVARENFFVDICKYFRSGRRNAVFEKPDMGVNAARGRSETDVDLGETSEQMGFLTVSRKRKR